MNEAENLSRLATIAGIEPNYWDIWGNFHETSDATRRALLDAMGIAADDDGAVQASIQEHEDAGWRRALPPVLVVREGQPVRVPVVVHADQTNGEIACHVVEEGGKRHTVRLALEPAQIQAQRSLDGAEVQKRTIEIPLALPLGYHDVMLDGDNRAMRLIVAPTRCYLPDGLAAGGRLWGVAAHLYSLRSQRSWGIGDFTDLAKLSEIAATSGAGTVGLNPLHALFPQDPDKASPYAPNSRLYLNVIYLDVEAIPDFKECTEAQVLVAKHKDMLANLRAAAAVDYVAVTALKLEVLELLFDYFTRHHLNRKRAGRAAAFRKFERDGGTQLHRFAVFSALAEAHAPTPWTEWPEAIRDPDAEAVESFARQNRDRVMFHVYLQWQAEEQLTRARRQGSLAGLDVGFYCDLAIAAEPSGADAWSEQTVIVQKARVGAPPDPFSPQGQNWGAPPMDPHRLRERAYAPFIALVQANMRHAGALRIDHAMGLKHLFWIPEGQQASEGAYVEYPFDDLLGVLALESHRNECIVIGEDLGTVPDGFRERMAVEAMLCYRVLCFEKDGDRFKRPPEYPPLALACFATHDLPTLRGFWDGQDIALRASLGQYSSPDDESAARHGRSHDKWLMMRELNSEGLLPDGINADDPDGTPMTDALAVAVHSYLARTPSALVIAQIDDITGEAEQVNLPGTDRERPNWRRRLGISLEDMAKAPLLVAFADAFSDRRTAPRPPA